MTSSEELALFSDTVESIYDAALTPANWPIVTEKIARLHGSPTAVLFAVRLEGVEPGFMFSYGISANGMALWESRYAREDIWVQGTIRNGLNVEGNVATGEEMVPDDVFLASNFYKEFLRPLDIGRILCGVIFDGSRTLLPMSACSLMRPHRDGPFDSHQRQLHRLITNHLSKAMGTMFRLRDAELRVASSLAALQLVSTPIFLAGADNQIYFANAAAEHILQARDGILLKRLRHGGAGLGTLSVRDAAVQLRLDRLLTSSVSNRQNDVSEHFSQALRVRRPSGVADYLIQVAPLGRDNEYSAAGREMRAIIFITDPGGGDYILDAAVLSQAYHLTTAEIALAQEIMRGDNLKTTALRMQLSQNTVKTQLQSIFAKTQTQRQSQLIKLLLSIPRATPEK